MKPILTLMLAGLLCGCGSSPKDALSNVKTEFPGAEVVPVTQSTYAFVIRETNGDIWYAECLGIRDDQITSKRKLLPGRP